jgi:D-alanyl-D-alanine carboxypeptidase
MIVSIVVLAALIIAGIYAFALHPPPTPKSVKNISDMEDYFNRLVESGSPPGLSVVVVKDGRLVYKKAFGYANGAREEKATPETVYHWWSMTKIPTAIAVMKLQEQGKLSLDDEVIKYLPWFEVHQPSGKSQAITIRNLLQHTSGLADTMPGMIGWVHYDDEPRNQTEIVKKQLNKFNTLKFETGMKAVYSNFNYMVLGAIIESVTGQPYEAFITQNILNPSGMAQTNFVYTPGMAEYEAVGTLPVIHFFILLLPFLLNIKALVHQRKGKLLWLNRVYIDATPSTGLIGPASDVARLMMAYLNSGSLDGQEILSPQSVSIMNETLPIDRRGLGWLMGGLQRSRFIEHSGGGPGFATIMRLYPDSRLGIVILSNGTDLDRHGLVDLMAKLDWQ